MDGFVDTEGEGEGGMSQESSTKNIYITMFEMDS